MGKVEVDNPMTKVKRNSEMDLCSVRSKKVRRKLEGAFQYSSVSYFLRWQEPNFFQKLFLKRKTKLIFCVNEAQLAKATAVIESLDLAEGDVTMIGKKSNNKYIF
ncbi:MAG: hypothetical protein MJ105_04580 [Lachnospiraceae bacterium]|nr:hypothetical protein [Lachnospiraceae bacterium]